MQPQQQAAICEYVVGQIAHWEFHNKATADKVMQQYETSTEGSNLRVCCHAPCSFSHLQ